MNDWEPDLYLKFVNERTQPTIDLVARINLVEPWRIIDVGCGPGNSTAVLRNRWPQAEIIGLDKSPEMILSARKAHPEGSWVEADASNWKDDNVFDIVFSNAVFHWIPNQIHLINHWMSQVAQNGVLAFQIPAQYDSPVHQVIFEVSRMPKWNDTLEAARNVLAKEKPGFYYDLLRPLSTKIELWETIYYHILESPDSIFEWFRSTGLRHFLDAFTNNDDRREFETMITRGYAWAYPPQKDGKILFPFKRLFIIVHK